MELSTEQLDLADRGKNMENITHNVTEMINGMASIRSLN